jgi:hypothetical protein
MLMMMVMVMMAVVVVLMVVVMVNMKSVDILIESFDSYHNPLRFPQTTFPLIHSGTSHFVRDNIKLQLYQVYTPWT